MIDHKLLSLLRCPMGGGMLAIADDSLVNRLNEMIEQGDAKMRDRLDQPVSAPIDGGLIDQAGQWLYPIRMGIPTLIADQAIAVPSNDA